MSIETNGSDYLIVETNRTLIAGTDFPVDRRLVFDVVGAGAGGNSGGSGYMDTTAVNITGKVKGYRGNAGLGGLSGEHRTYSFEKNHFIVGDAIVITLGVGGNGAVAYATQAPLITYVNIYAGGTRGSSGSATTILKNGSLMCEASGGTSPYVVVLSRPYYELSSAIVGVRASTGNKGWKTSVPFKLTTDSQYNGGEGGLGGVGIDGGSFAPAYGSVGYTGGFGSGGGGGGGGNCLYYHSSSQGFSGGNGGKGGNGFVSIRWGEFGAVSVNKEVFQPSFFSYSSDIGECFYAHMQQKMLAISSYKNNFINTFEDAVKATNGENLYTTVNGRQCYNQIGNIGSILLGGGSNAQRVSDFLTNIGYESTDVTNIAEITSRPDITDVRIDLTSAPSFRAVDLQFIADEMYDYFQLNGITKISISHSENAYNKNSNGVPSSGISILDSEVNAFTTTTGIIKYTQYLNNGQYCYAPESYYSELNNLVFKKEDGTVVAVDIAVRKASLAMILLSSNNFVTQIGSPTVNSVFSIDIELNGVVVHEDFRINIIPNFGAVEFSHYAMGTQLDEDTNKKDDLLNYVISGNTYKQVFCNLVWNSREYFLSTKGSGILQYSNGIAYIDVLKIRDENILDILYTFSQIMTLTVVKEDTNKSFWKTVIAGLFSVVIFVLSAYLAPILNISSQVINTALSFAWKEIVPPQSMENDFNNVYSVNISKVNDEEDDDTSTSVNFFDSEESKTKSIYNPYIEVKKMNESQYIPYNKGGIIWQQQ